MGKRITVLLSSYNGEKYIKTQIDSVLNQKLRASIFILIRDDGSTDQTVEILQRYEKKVDNIRLIKGENIGSIASFFTLIREAPESDYYACCDQDDYWEPDKLATAIAEMEHYDKSIPLLYGSSSYLTDENLQIVGETQKKKREITIYNTMIQNILPGHSQVFNSTLAAIINEHIFDYSRIYVHDSFISNIAAIYGRIIFDNSSHTLYRQYDKNQLGYGNSSIDWIKQRIERVKKSDGKKYAIQMNYICEVFEKDIPKDVREEMNHFFGEQDKIWKRIRYATHTKLYRQKWTENILFKVLYISGGYTT